MDIKVKVIVNGFFFGNCYIAWSGSSKCIVIDPGDEAELIYNTIRELDLEPHLIVATRANIDSIGAVEELREMLSVKFAVHEDEKEILDFLPEMVRYLGLPGVKIPSVDVWLSEGDVIEAGDIRLNVIHTPGHTPGSISLVGDGFVFTGDTLLAGSYGRTDLKGGSEEKILESIKKKLFSLPGATTVYPGHGPATTIKNEKANNWAVFRKI